MVGQHLPQPVSVHDKTPVIKSCWGSSLWLLSSFICTIYLSCDKHLSIAFNWRLMEFVNSSMQHTDAYMKTPRCCGASGHPNAWMCTQEKHVWWIRPSFKPNTKPSVFLWLRNMMTWRHLNIIMQLKLIFELAFCFLFVDMASQTLIGWGKCWSQNTNQLPSEPKNNKILFIICNKIKSQSLSFWSCCCCSWTFGIEVAYSGFNVFSRNSKNEGWSKDETRTESGQGPSPALVLRQKSIQKRCFCAKVSWVY